MAKSKVLISWSSGKDSAWLVHTLRRMPEYEIGGLMTTMNAAANRVTMHAVRLSLLEAQATALGLPLRTVYIPSPCSNEIYDRAMGDAVRRVVEEGFTHVAFGDLLLEDVRRYREERLAGTGLTPLFPLFGLPTHVLAHTMIEAGLRARITCVNPKVLPRKFIGREFDVTLLDELPPDANPCGENGEFHTFAYAGPMFSAPVPIESGVVVERDGFVFADLHLGQP
jgi:uncharacterized protein (TIGR00290 family)